MRYCMSNNAISGIGSGAVSVPETLDVPMAAGNFGKTAKGGGGTWLDKKSIPVWYNRAGKV